ncbi:hypothetical protein LSCM1_00024 [Leishmania martiniquensis]|uniref:Uncharacterized protein n=1 Tax=Leishmania martiniquensis TaxID=1580590 RepID=A0A836K9H7_9TRYP|nr:hypothetical protein LSCM1_00024 [Leishmania martiniquensis]
MLFDSDDDDLPEVPTTGSDSHAVVTTSAIQAQRLQQLEEEYRATRAESAAGRQRDASCRSSSPPLAPVKAARSVWEERDEAAFYELRSLVPHLSPQFTCSYSDAVLLIAAIQRGGAVSGNRDTLADKCQSLDADRRQLEQRLEKSRARCEELKSEVAEVRQKMKAMEEKSKSSVNALAQRREEMRKQLLLEEVRAEKLMIRNKMLQRENDSLKERVRGQAR